MKIVKSTLKGTVKVSGAKNSALRLLAASILNPEPIRISNFPSGLLDVQIHIKMLEVLGKKITLQDDTIEIAESESILKTDLVWEGRSIRNTLLILGALAVRFGKGKVPLPGGCNLGERKYNLHIHALKELGANVWEENNYLNVECKKKRLYGNEIHLPIRSTGATENAIIMGTLAVGKTIIYNPHIRPEIIDLISFLRKMGAKIKVLGQLAIEIEGVETLRSVDHKVIPDNMEALTWAIGSVITNGDVEIINFPFEHLEVPLVFLRESGMKYYRGEKSLIVRGGKPYPIEISTGPYPGINSDMQPLFAVYGASSDGESKIIDLRFPGRYRYVEELAKLGMNYSIEGDLLKIYGGNNLKGAKVHAIDLRAGISLLLAGLSADGETIIEDAWQIMRGYENLKEKLESLIK